MFKSLIFYGLLAATVITLPHANSQVQPLTRVQRRQREKQILDKVLGPSSSYDPDIRPSGGNSTHGETQVFVNIMLNYVSRIDDFKMEYSVQLTLRMEWTDDRLKFSTLDPSKSIQFLTISDIKRIWIPDIFFINEKESHFHNMIKPNRFIRIFPDGSVGTSIRMSLTLSCPMNLRMFPMDTQVCVIEMSSYAWTTQDLDFQWKESNPLQLPVKLSLPRFSLLKNETSSCDHQTLTGVYSCLRADFTLTRNFSFYLTQMYIPCIMLVIVSWVSFWLDENSAPARTALGITTLLTMTAQRANMNQNLPPVSYIKALDIWSGTCLLFIFAALLEYALVNYALRLDKRRKKEKQEQFTEAGEAGMEPDSSGGCCGSLIQRYPSRSKRVDVIARILFPSLFIIFNLTYWLVYLG